jgi:uracil-DNA glycosylase family 4
VGSDDGLVLTGAWVSSVVRCAPPDNKPSNEERDECSKFLVRERNLLTNVRVIVCLGNFSYTAVCKEFGIRPRPKFAHAVEVQTDGLTIICSFHPSQQNTFTGKLTEPMLDAVFSRARELSK